MLTTGTPMLFKCSASAVAIATLRCRPPVQPTAIVRLYLPSSMYWGSRYSIMSVSLSINIPVCSNLNT